MKELEYGGVKIKESGLDHVLGNHTYINGGPRNQASYFKQDLTKENLIELIESGNNYTPTLQRHGTYKRTFDVGYNIGYDRINYFQETSIMTVITDEFGNLITAYPGA